MLLNANSAIFQLYHGENKLVVNEMMMRSALYFHSAGSLKQQSAGRHIAPLGHIILIPRQPVFTLFSLMLCEATHTNFIFFGLTQPGIEPTIYRTRGERTNHYATDAII